MQCLGAAIFCTTPGSFRMVPLALPYMFIIRLQTTMATFSAHGLQHFDNPTKCRYFWMSLFVVFTMALIVVIIVHKAENVTTVKVRFRLLFVESAHFFTYFIICRLPFFISGKCHDGLGSFGHFLYFSFFSLKFLVIRFVSNKRPCSVMFCWAYDVTSPAYVCLFDTLHLQRYIFAEFPYRNCILYIMWQVLLYGTVDCNRWVYICIGVRLVY